MTANKAITELLRCLPQREVVLFPKGKVALPATIHVAGVDRNDGERPYDNDGLKRGPRSFVLLQHTIAGSGRLRFEDRHFTVLPGQSMLITVPHDHRYWLPRGGDWTYFWLCFHGHEAMHICKHIIETAGPVITLSPKALEAAAGVAVDVIHGRVTTPTQSSTLAYDLVMHLYGETEQRPAREAHERPPALERAISYCRDNLTRSIGVADLARASGYSRFHFVRRFRDSEGVAPSEFIRLERMSMAARMLVETELPIAAIAERSGFVNSNYFTKVFRRVYGMPPTAFRHRE
jgi:AraC-like DNA-binding protein